ncbi:hypothetical protein [Secundilactobacillus similis]|uniref:Uncharacterized protein n=1 Tax=Secundilactobacillus similis DSM 23365 = JCM 2765 TaxID=1423804 RepID=A0A0R2EMK5_9LACO|nr:hypothetical protein [Secundilactobacillus similis]KRN15173.1 hypothetical protein FD14_GL002992 [Secundilactobacillus similis DSM 23365 = JCM 2765]
MLFSEPTLAELMTTYLNLLENSRRFLKPDHQLEIILQITDDTTGAKIEVRNEQLKQVSRLRIRNGTAGVTVNYQGTSWRTYHGFTIQNHRFKPKFFWGYVGTEKMDQNRFTEHLATALHPLLRPKLNCVVFPNRFV